jgi:hypothetical protein
MVARIVWTLLIGAAVAGAPARAGEPAARSWVRLDSGRQILVIGQIERDGGLMLYRTATGLLASIPASRVVAVEPVARPDRSPDERPDELPARSVPDVPVFTNDDLPTEPLPWRATIDRATGSTDVAPTAETGSEIPALGYDAYRDRNGNDEAWWRERAAAIDAEREEALDEYEIWSQRYRSLSDLVALECVGRRFARYLPATCAEYVRLQRDANERAADARAWLEEVDAERRNLSDEARRANALPGWLR